MNVTVWSHRPHYLVGETDIKQTERRAVPGAMRLYKRDIHTSVRSGGKRMDRRKSLGKGPRTAK